VGEDAVFTFRTWIFAVPRVAVIACHQATGRGWNEFGV